MGEKAIKVASKYVDLLTSLHRLGMDAGVCRPTMPSLGLSAPHGCSINAPLLLCRVVIEGRGASRILTSTT